MLIILEILRVSVVLCQIETNIKYVFLTKNIRISVIHLYLLQVYRNAFVFLYLLFIFVSLISTSINSNNLSIGSFRFSRYITLHKRITTATFVPF